CRQWQQRQQRRRRRRLLPGRWLRWYRRCVVARARRAALAARDAAQAALALLDDLAVDLEVVAERARQHRRVFLRARAEWRLRALQHLDDRAADSAGLFFGAHERVDQRAGDLLRIARADAFDREEADVLVEVGDVGQHAGE